LIEFHGSRYKNHPIEERFWSKVYKTNHCWVWLARKDDNGYGTFKEKGKSLLAHRVCYALEYGLALDDIPPELDHTCDTKSCVRPDHLNPVTHQENMDGVSEDSRWNMGSRNRDKLECPQGHPYIESNIYYYRGDRKCKICVRERSMTRYYQNRDEINARRRATRKEALDAT